MSQLFILEHFKIFSEKLHRVEISATAESKCSYFVSVCVPSSVVPWLLFPEMSRPDHHGTLPMPIPSLKGFLVHIIKL